MKLKSLSILILLLISSNGFADCTTPCGAEELISCAAQSIGMTAEDFYNKKLFDTNNLDGFCKNPPAGSVTTGQQQYYFSNYCGTNTGGYFSYANFIATAANFPVFACQPNTSKESRYKELANFFTTVAQETTSSLYGYTNDGLYFRYENGALLGTTLDDKTVYYPRDDFLIGTNNGDNTLTYTGNYWSGASGGALIYNLTVSPVNITYGPVVIPGGYTQNQLNQIIQPGFWIGMGAKQLTGDSMMGFFGWYFSNLAEGHPIASSNFPNFVNSYLTDGLLGFNGAFWYWMYRVNGIGYIPIHQIVTNPDRPVCQDIATVTRMVNGGCNNYNPGRVNYYQYFMNTVFKIPIVPVTGTFIVDGVPTELNSMDCTESLQKYCQQP